VLPLPLIIAALVGSLYVLLAGDEALQVVAGDDIYWKRRLSKALRMERE
jgi:hypothetical protein